MTSAALTCLGQVEHGIVITKYGHLGGPLPNIDFYEGGPVGLETLAATIGEEAVTLEDVYEPYLLQQGFLTRTPRGRCVTRRAYEHLGLEYIGQQEIDL